MLPSPNSSALILTLFFLLSPARSQDPNPDADVCPAAGSGSVPEPEPSCRVNCFRPDPVCGVNGVTYWCGCPEAACAGVRVAKRGYCEVGSGGAGAVSGQAFLLIHIVWLIILGFSVLCGFL